MWVNASTTETAAAVQVQGVQQHLSPGGGVGAGGPRATPMSPLPLPQGTPPPPSQAGHAAAHSLPDPDNTPSPAALNSPVAATGGHSPGPPAGGPGGPLVTPKIESPGTPPAAAAAPLEAGRPGSERQDGEAWPWAPGTVLNIDQEQWKALSGANDPPTSGA